MGRTRKTKEVEIHEFYVFRSTSGSQPACDECAPGKSIMVEPEHAALLAKVRLPMIYRGIETGSIHYKLDANGALIVCLKSLVVMRTQVKEVNNEIIKPTERK